MVHCCSCYSAKGRSLCRWCHAVRLQQKTAHKLVVLIQKLWVLGSWRHFLWGRDDIKRKNNTPTWGGHDRSQRNALKSVQTICSIIHCDCAKKKAFPEIVGPSLVCQAFQQNSVEKLLLPQACFFSFSSFSLASPNNCLLLSDRVTQGFGTLQGNHKADEKMAAFSGGYWKNKSMTLWDSTDYY